MGGATGERAEQAARTFRSIQPVPDSHTTANTSIPIIIHAVQSALMLPLKMAPAIAPGERALLVGAPPRGCRRASGRLCGSAAPRLPAGAPHLPRRAYRCYSSPGAVPRRRQSTRPSALLLRSFAPLMTGGRHPGQSPDIFSLSRRPTWPSMNSYLRTVGRR